MRRKIPFLLITLGVVLILGLLWYTGPKRLAATDDVTKICVTHKRGGMHTHSHLRIVIKGQEVPIPANIGIPSSFCMRPIHTHDSTGTIHLEFPQQRQVKLSEFFRVWGKPFSRTQILEYTVDHEHEILMTVNGQVSEAYENLLLQDKDQIVIEYDNKDIIQKKRADLGKSQ